MTKYAMTYKKTTNSIGLPTEIEAEGYDNKGRFFEFYVYGEPTDLERASDTPGRKLVIDTIASDQVIRISVTISS